MLTHSKKACLLAKVGVAVPLFPARSLPVQERYLRRGARVPQAELDADEAQALAVSLWQQQVDELYRDYLQRRDAPT